MKQIPSIIISFVLVFGFFFIEPQTTLAAVPTDFLACWDLDEESDTRIDEAGTSDLDDFNTVLFGTGIQGNAADFEEDLVEYLSTTSGAAISSSADLSISFWHKHETDLGNNSGWYIITHGAGTGGAANWGLQFYHNAGVPQWVFVAYESSAPTANVNIRVNQTLTAGTWYHIVMTFDLTGGASEGLMEIFSNGTSVGTKNDATLNDLNGGDFDLTMGASSAHIQPFDGLLDIVEVYDRVLTSAEITALYNSGSGVPCAGRGAVAEDPTTPASILQRNMMFGGNALIQ